MATDFNPYSHYPTDYNTGMIDWWDEGVDTGYNTYTFTLSEQFYNSTIEPLSDYEIYEQEGGGDIPVPAGYEVFYVKGDNDEPVIMTDSTGAAFLTKDAAEALGV